MTRNKPIPVNSLVVTPGATLKVIDDSGSCLVWHTIRKSVAYTPKAINNVMIEENLDQVWVFWVGGKELWHKGQELAVRY